MDAVSAATVPDMPLPTYPGMDLTNILGPLFWGTLVSMILVGITTMQAYHYFPSKDRPVVQLIALSMLVLDLLSSALAAQGLNHYLLPHFGSTIPLDRLVPAFAAECVATTFIIAISQFYFAWQISVLGQKSPVGRAVSGAVAVLSLLAFAGGLACSVVMFTHASHILTSRAHTFNVMAGLAKAPATLADIIATCYLCYTLGYARTGVRATDSVLKTLIGFVIQRGVLVSLVQTGFLIIFYMSSSRLYWLGLHVNVTRIYANTFFAMLHGREGLKKELGVKSVAVSAFETSNHTHLDNPFHASRVSKKGINEDRDGIEASQSVWMDTIKGRNPVDAFEVAQIQVDRKVVVSDI